MMCHAGFGGVDPASGDYYCFLETFAGGYGGRAASDGPDAVQTHGQNTENAPVEETELNYPVRVARLSLVDDSEGPGRFRGGLGLRKDFVFDRPTTFTVLADRTVRGPAGAFGGLDGRVAEYVLVRGGEERRLGAKTTLELEAGDTISYRTCGGGGYGPAVGARPRARAARRARGQGVGRARARGLRRHGRGRARMAVDPITFEVIRNALVAATDEMVVALKRSAYSTNIKTRSDFSCAFFDAELRSVAQGFAQPVHLGSMSRAGAERDPRVRRGELGPRDMLLTNSPYPSGVHLNDVSLIAPVYVEGELLGYVANLAHHVDVGGGAPASHRRVPRGVPGGRDHPAGAARPRRADRRTTSSGSCSRRSARSTRPPATSGRRWPRTTPACGASRRSPRGTGATRCVATMDELLAYTERRTLAELAALPHGVYEAEGVVDNDGYTDEPVRLQARVELRPDGARFDTTGSDPQRRAPVNSTFAMTFSACAYALKMPGRSRPAGQRRLLPPDRRRRAGGHGDERPLAGCGRRRLGDARPARRGDHPRAAAGVPRAADGGDEGDDVPGGLRLARRGEGLVHVLLRHVRRRLRRAARRATAPTRCRRTGRTPRTRRSRRPS